MSRELPVHFLQLVLPLRDEVKKKNAEKLIDGTAPESVVGFAKHVLCKDIWRISRDGESITSISGQEIYFWFQIFKSPIFRKNSWDCESNWKISCVGLRWTVAWKTAPTAPKHRHSPSPRNSSSAWRVTVWTKFVGLRSLLTTWIATCHSHWFLLRATTRSLERS